MAISAPRSGNMFRTRLNCPSCGSGHHSLLYETSYSNPGLREYLRSYYNKVDPKRQAEWLENGKYELSLCQQCGLIFQREVPNDAFMAELYGEWLGKNDPLAPHKPQLPLDYYAYMVQELLQIYEFLRRRGLPEERPAVLDFGAGWGNWAQVARALGGKLTVAEMSPPKVSHLRSVGLNVRSLEELEGGRAGFDFISTEQVLEHLADPNELAARLIKLLRPGGIIKLSVPDGQGIRRIMHGWNWNDAYRRRDDLMAVHPLEHLNCFTSSSLDNFAGQLGLSRTALPLGLGYAYPATWANLPSVARGLLRPLKRHLLKRGCWALYTHG